MKSIIFKKILTLLAVCILFLTVGTVYGILTRDKLFIVMSVIIAVVNFYKIIALRRIEREEKYYVISGTCVDMTYKLMGKYRLYKIKDGSNMIEISVPKLVKLKLNEEYKFYFKKTASELNAYGDWLKNQVLSENFLGYENVFEASGGDTH